MREEPLMHLTATRNVPKGLFPDGTASILRLTQDRRPVHNILGGKYSDPEFVWHNPIAPTAIEFLDSKKLGDKYQNDIFVGSFNYPRIIHFHLNEERNGLYLRGPLEDRVEHNPQGYGAVVFGRNFGRIVGLETGPDGYLYVLSLAPDG
jgi:glucose/arabinose dehydrogenase